MIDRANLKRIKRRIKRIAAEGKITSAQGMAPEGRGREGGPGSSELPSPVGGNADASKGA